MTTQKRKRFWVEEGYCFEDWPDAGDCRLVHPDEIVTKRERKLRDQYNRIVNLFPGKHRIWDLDRIADEFAIEAAYETDDETRKTIYEQALILSRLAWDLMEIRDVIRGNPRKEGPLSRNDPANWPRGPRP